MGERRVVARSVLMISVLVQWLSGCAGTGRGPAGTRHAARAVSATPVQPPEGSQQRPDETISVRISDGMVTGVPSQVEVNRGNRGASR